MAILNKEQTEYSIGWTYVIGSLLKGLTLISKVTVDNDNKTGECIFETGKKTFIVTVEEIQEE